MSHNEESSLGATGLDPSVTIEAVAAAGPGVPLEDTSEAGRRKLRWLGWGVAGLTCVALVGLLLAKVTGGSMNEIAGPDSPAIARIHAEAAGRSLAYTMPEAAAKVAGRSGAAVHLIPEVRYTVHTGGKLEDVARIFNMPVELLQAINPELPADRFLGPGSDLRIFKAGVTTPPEVEDKLLEPLCSVPMKDGPGRRIRRRSVSWATDLTVDALDRALTAYGQAYPQGPVVIVSDLSRRGGGRLKPHNTHREGRDVDLSYIPKPEHDNGGFIKMKGEYFDTERNWTFIKAMLDTGAVKLILMDWSLQRILYKHAQTQGASPQWLSRTFQYPREREVEEGLIRHWDGHRDHMHVRFACPRGMEACD